MAKTAKKSTKSSKKRIFRRISLVITLISIFMLGILYFLNVMPFIYFLIITIIIFLIDFFILVLLVGQGWKKRLFGMIFSVIYLVGLLVVIWYGISTLDFFSKIGGQDFNTENYSVLVLKDSDYKKIKNLKDKTIGVVNSNGVVTAQEKLNKKVSVNYKTLDDLNDLVDSFLNKEIDAILVENANKNLLEDDYENFYESYRDIYKFSIDVKIEDSLAKQVDITKDSFNVFVSGIDTFGKITSVSRSDVNMVISVNPQTHTILFTSIPRDYYVKLHGIKTTYKDKLTHAGIHGIETSIGTVEDLLDIDINYYAKVNFTSLIDIVNAIGGIDVNVDKPFRAYWVGEKDSADYRFTKGINHLNGKQALAFSRERKSLAKGDVARAEHQQMVLEAIINKVLSKKIITKYNSILNSVEGKFVTNIGTKNITNLIKKQIKNNDSWTIIKNTLSGTDKRAYTYSYQKVTSYVMEPNEESVNIAKDKIKEVLAV